MRIIILLLNFAMSLVLSFIIFRVMKLTRKVKVILININFGGNEKKWPKEFVSEFEIACFFSSNLG